MLRRTIVAVMLCAGAAATAHAQWVNHPAPGIPRTKDGKPNLSAPTPRGANGKPDLRGSGPPIRHRSRKWSGCLGT